MDQEIQFDKTKEGDARFGFEISKNDYIGNRDRAQIFMDDGEAFNRKGRIAILLVERWGMVVGKIDGEDTAGRSKIVLQSPEELVERACNTADHLIDEIRKRGWAIPTPRLSEAQAHLNGLDDDKKKKSRF